MVPGDRLLKAVGEVRRRLVLVAPFVKRHVLVRLMGALPALVPLVVYTRWRPEEVAAGVSDLDVFDVVAGRPLSELWLCSRLHAKFYRCDDVVLFGSANLTGMALGWAERSNLELLVATAWTEANFGSLERELLAQSVQATHELRMLVERAASALKPQVVAGHDDSSFDGPALSPVHWLPVTRHPEYLYRAYGGQAAELTSAGAEQTAIDLARLSLVPGMGMEAFVSVVRALLLQNPIVVAVERFGARPRRFGEMRAFVAEQLSAFRLDRDPTEAWQTLLRWFLCFFPDRYRVEIANYSEVFCVR